MNGLVNEYINKDWVKVTAKDQETAEGYAEMIITFMVKDIWRSGHEMGLHEGYNEGFEDGKENEKTRILGALKTLKAESEDK